MDRQHHRCSGSPALGGIWLGAILSCACTSKGRDTGADGSADELARACIVATSCAGPASLVSATKCIEEVGRAALSGLQALQAHMLACARRTTCEEFRACWGGGLVMVQPMVSPGVCQGNTMVAPNQPGSPFPALSFDCGAIGSQCEGLASNDIRVGCNARPCDHPTPTEPACVGTVASGCGGWSEYTTVDCGGSDRVCQVEGGQAACKGAGAACDESDPVKCRGSVAEYCENGGVATVDCATVPFRTACSEGSVSNQACAPAGTECDPYSFVDHCEDSSLQVCADGRVTSVDCTQLGFSLCSIYAVGPGHCREKI